MSSIAVAVRPVSRPAVIRRSRSGHAGNLRLTPRGRVVVSALVMVVVALPASLGIKAAQADSPEVAPEVSRHVVVPGETLWGIAESIAEPGEDVRDVVHDLVVLNDLPNSGLMAGQTIVVPISD